ncbi:unnamed protein product [Polarella glacialis]|uniref:GmrSD restriction endonucleases N-terminal domain-containing protein n=1 Tax=Polarella glacialis TaxID=89957 RepID=A0A813E5J2_POLGL|nr:unnamed protein product [Polarella glacialis]
MERSDVPMAPPPPPQRPAARPNGVPMLHDLMSCDPMATSQRAAGALALASRAVAEGSSPSSEGPGVLGTFASTSPPWLCAAAINGAATSRRGVLGTFASTAPPWSCAGAVADGRAVAAGRAGRAPAGVIPRSGPYEMLATSAPSQELDHGSFFCGPLHGPGAVSQHVERVALRRLLSRGRTGAGGRQLVVPPFQRPYCWGRAQVEAWWRDSLAASAASGGTSHSAGRVVLGPAFVSSKVPKGRQGLGQKESSGPEVDSQSADRGTKIQQLSDSNQATPPQLDGEALIIIDGQQRLTTALLLVLAVGLTAADLAASASEEGEEGEEGEKGLRLSGCRSEGDVGLSGVPVPAGAPKTAVFFGGVAEELRSVAREAAEVVFRRTDHDKADSEQPAQQQEDQEQQWPSLSQCSCLTLVPSLGDRALVLSLAGALSLAISTGRRPASKAPSGSAGLLGTPERGRGSAAAALRQALRSALDGVGVMLVQLGPSAEGESALSATSAAQQVYLWLEEKATGAAALRSGVPLGTADLARSLFLAPLLRRPSKTAEGLEDQERAVRDLWLPIERQAAAGEGLRQLLLRFTGYHEQEQETGGERGELASCSELGAYYRLAAVVEELSTWSGGTLRGERSTAERKAGVMHQASHRSSRAGKTPGHGRRSEQSGQGFTERQHQQLQQQSEQEEEMDDSDGLPAALLALRRFANMKVTCQCELCPEIKKQQKHSSMLAATHVHHD